MNWKAIYEAFKEHSRLDEYDKKMIEMSDKMLALNKPHINDLVYSKLWLQSWINTFNYRLFIEDLLSNKSKFNAQIY
jgi:hypothetical protein